MATADITTTLRRVLADDDRVALLVGDRIRPSRPAQGDTKSIRYRTISDRRQRTVGPSSSLRLARIQFDCYAPTRLEAKEIGDRVTTALDGLSGQVGETFVDDCVEDNAYDTSDAPVPGSDKARYIRVVDFEVSYQHNEIES